MLSAAVLATLCLAADLQLAAVFSDHLVLQREKPVPVWGFAAAGTHVTVEFAGQKKSAVAGADGRWMVKLAALPASSEPRTLAASTAAGERAEAKDVLVGEVWLGSGQSNMAMSVRGSKDFPAEQAAARFPLIRMFKEESVAARQPNAAARGQWQPCSPETVGPFSATLYFFGREIFRQLGGNVPVGLVNSSVGGTPIESWIAAEAQLRVPELKAHTEELEQRFVTFDAAKAPKTAREQHDRRGGPGDLFNGKIAPLVPFALRGMLWYQGEANAQPKLGELYAIHLPLLVNDWRARWGEAVPFAWAQLPNFKRDGEGWSLVREAQLKTLRLPKTGMAVTVDIGEAGDIHPKNKQEVGRRLALWALAEVYRKPGVVAGGPLPGKHRARGGAIVVEFTNAAGGLRARDGGAVTGFAVAGEDGVFKPAAAKIEGARVVVASPEVTAPVAVRYAWEADPVCNLVNSAGLPASPFRLGSSSAR